MLGKRPVGMCIVTTFTRGGGWGDFLYPDTLPFDKAGQVLSSPLAEVAWPEVHHLMMLKVSDPERPDAAVFKDQVFYPHGEELVALYTSDHSFLTTY